MGIKLSGRAPAHVSSPYWDAEPITSLREAILNMEGRIADGENSPELQKQLEINKKNLKEMIALYNNDITEYHNRYLNGAQTLDEQIDQQREQYLQYLSQKNRFLRWWYRRRPRIYVAAKKQRD